MGPPTVRLLLIHLDVDDRQKQKANQKASQKERKATKEMLRARKEGLL